MPWLWGLNRCPEFKGIETACLMVAWVAVILNRCPEFKGIETNVTGVLIIGVH